MAYRENSSGSSVYLLKNKRLITTYLTGITRRKQYVILFFICFILLLILYLHTNGETQKKHAEIENIGAKFYSQSSVGSEIQMNYKEFQDGAQPYQEEKYSIFMDNIFAIPSSRESDPFETQEEQDLNSSIVLTYSKFDEYTYEDTTFVTTENHDSELRTVFHDSFISNEIRSNKPLNSSVLNDNTTDIEKNTTQLFAQALSSMESSPLQPLKNSSFLLDNPGCRIPKLDPWDPSVIDLIKPSEPYECPGPPLFMKSELDGSISLNETVLELYYNLMPDEISCYYHGIYRKHEENGYVFESSYMKGNDTYLKFRVPLNEEFVGVECTLGNVSVSQYFAFPLLKKEVEEERDSLNPSETHLNVILVGVDSVSRLNFHRHFQKTRTFLEETLSAFDMKGYTKVGDNTFPNLVPLLTGHSVEHYYNESLQFVMFFDGLDLIWKDYAKRGYRTFFAEDKPHIGTFNYLKRGFYDPPTDYYFRTLALALEDSKVKQESKPLCLNSQLETDFIYDYLKDFTRVMESRPYNAFVMTSAVTHDDLNYAGYADEPTVNLLEDLWLSGALNNSVLVLFSDHGIRYGDIRHTYLGKVEERMPFMYIYFPKSFLEQYPEIGRNLHNNQERLMTLFDIHATMIHLLDLTQDMASDDKKLITLGSSLLKEISPNRNCEEANIPSHFCPCHSFEAIPLNDTTAFKASQAIVDNINAQLLPYNESCAVLQLDELLDARLGHGDVLLQKFVEHDKELERTIRESDKLVPHDDYLITLTTKPGGAVFEGTARYTYQNGDFDVLGISRINMYGNQSICIDIQKMKLFCYCIS